MAENKQNDKSIFSKIWNDPVCAGVISFIIISLLSFVAQHFLSVIKTCKEFFEMKIPFGIALPVVVDFVAMILFLLCRIRKSNKKITEMNSDFEKTEQNYKKEIETLKNKIADLEKEPEDKRLFEFSIGDTVIRKLDKENPFANEYCVAEIDRKNCKVIVRDKNNQKEVFLPGELFTATETVAVGKVAVKNFGDMINPRKNYGGFGWG